MATKKSIERYRIPVDYVITDALNPAITSSVQWFERTLDDSQTRALSIPEEGFPCTIDGILDLCMNVVDGLVVYPKVILKHMMLRLPFYSSQNIMMDAVKAGGDRQELHERIRELSMIAGKHVKEEGRDNDLLDLIAADEMFHLTKEELEKTMDPSKYTGRASVQVDAFLKNVVNPVLGQTKRRTWHDSGNQRLIRLINRNNKKTDFISNHKFRL